MGFFSDLKEDLSQAVNELMPNEEQEITKKEQEEAEVSLDEMLQNIDAIQLDETDKVQESTKEQESILEAEPDTQQDSPMDDVDIESMLESVMATKDVPEESSVKENKGAEKVMDNYAGRTVSDETAVITGGMTITGDIVSEGSIDIIGCVNGNIDILGKLNITGHINGDDNNG